MGRCANRAHVAAIEAGEPKVAWRKDAGAVARIAGVRSRKRRTWQAPLELKSGQAARRTSSAYGYTSPVVQTTMITSAAVMIPIIIWIKAAWASALLSSAACLVSPASRASTSRPALTSRRIDALEPSIVRPLMRAAATCAWIAAAYIVRNAASADTPTLAPSPQSVGSARRATAIPRTTINPITTQNAARLFTAHILPRCRGPSPLPWAGGPRVALRGLDRPEGSPGHVGTGIVGRSKKHAGGGMMRAWSHGRVKRSSSG